MDSIQCSFPFSWDCLFNPIFLFCFTDEVSEAEKTDHLTELEQVVKNNELYIAQVYTTVEVVCYRKKSNIT